MVSYVSCQKGLPRRQFFLAFENLSSSPNCRDYVLHNILEHSSHVLLDNKGTLVYVILLLARQFFLVEGENITKLIALISGCTQRVTI